MFPYKSIASLMSWHVKGSSKDGKIRVPSDSEAWKHIDKQWPESHKSLEIYAWALQLMVLIHMELSLQSGPLG